MEEIRPLAGPPAAPPGPDDRIWYAAYGSNMSVDRLTHYLRGGRAHGDAHRHPGCRDTRPPRRSAPVHLPGLLYFALESRVWGGGMGFYDAEQPDATPARAHLLTVGQFSDIVGQEMGRPAGTDLDLTTVLRSGRDPLGSGRYETLVCPGTLGGVPVLTFTAPWTLAGAALNVPRVGYLRHLAAGLAEAHGWPPERAAPYLSSRPGAADHWTAAGLLAALAGDPAGAG
ncbi:histone deacetylase [Kitasatospora sp. NPDC002965]|uniref:histone deacetylase n=1 Tax=Kitasatospora sp. NPDC002965 TaxID=3154775 RepID=UPI0033B6E186